jgi:hypothetical protein
MITRGYFIGEIVDELVAIAAQVEGRCALGITDLNRYLENFFRDVLNILLKHHLENLNTDTINAPGLDLGDASAGVAFQVTSQKTSLKMNDTLTKVLSVHLEKTYPKIRILIIGSKQGSYSLDSTLTAPLGFSEEDIWDVGDLCKKTMDLRLDDLETLHKTVKANVAKVKVELEVPNLEGQFPTSIGDYIEKIPRPSVGSGETYYKFFEDRGQSLDGTAEDARKHYLRFSEELKELPRLTREFFAFLLERRDKDQPAGPFSDHLRFNDDRLRGICRLANLDAEIRLLVEHRFVSINEPDDYGKSPYLTLRYPFKPFSHYLLVDLVTYIEERKLGYLKVIGSLDFSDF